MDIITALILGITQGLTEFLPVSSSGHLILVCSLLRTEPSLALELVLHIGTLLAVIIFYRKSLCRRITKPLCRDNLLLIFATVCSGIIALAIRYFCGNLQNTATLPYFFIATGILLVIGSRGKSSACLDEKRSALIGIAQGLAVFPGLSRSGTTISVARMLGIKQQDATEFSFLLSIPIIVVSTVVELCSSPLVTIAPAAIATGLVASFISGYISLVIISKLVKKASFDIFSLYLFALSAVILITKFT